MEVKKGYLKILRQMLNFVEPDNGGDSNIFNLLQNFYECLIHLIFEYSNDTTLTDIY